MLSYEPDQRPSLEELKKHPWLNIEVKDSEMERRKARESIE